MRERFPPDDPREWLNRARSNLAQARIRAPEVYLEDLCFNAQQATEKALKALLIALGIRFPYVHDIGVLLGLIENAGISIPQKVGESAKLTRFAVFTRYPGVGEPVTEEEYLEAVELAETTVDWVTRHLEKAQDDAE